MTFGTRIRSHLLISAVPAFLALMAGVAQAQIETVTVTAQRTEQNIQSVPIAITAFTGVQLQERGMTDIHALSGATPNVNFDAGAPFSGDSSVLSASIRGIGQDDFAFNIEPGVGVYLDGVYIARTIGANVDLMDVDRVEVLKGPQGTLFGRNTIGGAINIVTRTPGDQYSLEVQATTGSLDRRDISASADIPISDTLHSSLTFASYERDGYQKVIPYNNAAGYNFDPYPFSASGIGTDNAYGGQNHQAARGKLVWTPTNSFTATLSADWAHQNQQAIPNTVVQSFPNTPGAGTSIAALYMACLAGAQGQPPGAPNFDNLCNLRRAQDYPVSFGGLEPLHNSNLLPILPSTTMTNNIDTTYANGPDFARYDVEGVSLTLEDRLSDDLTLKSITGGRHITWNIGIDLDGSADNGMLLSVTDKQRQTQFSQEFQMIGKLFDDRLSYVAGLYYFYEEGFVHDWVPFDGGLLYVYDEGLNLIRTSSYAGYAHFDYKVTDALGITVGARYSIDHKEFNGGQTDLNGLSYKASGCNPPNAPSTLIGGPPFLDCQQLLGFPIASDPYRYFPAGWSSQNFYEFTPTLGVQYHVNDDVMLYASWAKGFKSGGWTTRLSAPIADPTVAEYKPEKAKTWELGLKSEWWDNRLVLNLAGFYTDYEDIQLNEQQGASPVLSNLGTAHMKGGELEAEADLGGGFLVNGSVGYIDAHYVYVSPLVAQITPGAPQIGLNSKLPKTPEWHLNLSPEWNHTLENGNSIQVLASYSYTSSMYNDAENTPLLKRKPVNMLDASVHYLFDGGKYDAAVGGTNILDERYIYSGSHNYAAGFIDATYSAPAEWYISMTAHF